MSDEPTRVGFVLLPRFNMLTLTSLIEPMRIANYLAPQRLFSWDYRAPEPGVVTASNGLQVECSGLTGADVAVAEIVIVCGSWGAENYENPVLFRWLRRQNRDGRRIIGVELGTYTLARAGLLDGRRATTHWSVLAGFAEAFPNIDVCEQLYTADDRIFTCAGGTSGLDLMLDLLARQCGEQLAIEAGNQILHHPRRSAESTQRVATGGRSPNIHNDVRSAMKLLESNVSEPLSVPHVCRKLGVSQRKLERLFRRDTGCTIAQYGKLVRLQNARVLLSTTHMSIREVSAACGFNSMSYFSMSFFATFGKKPSEYRQAWPENAQAPSWPGTVYSFIQGSHGLRKKE